MIPDGFVLLDLGTARTTMLRVELTDGAMRYGGHISAATPGLRKGVVVSLPLAAEGIRLASAALEQQTGIPVERVFLSISGSHVKGLGSQAGISLTSRSREVTRDDARRVLDLARSITLPEDRQILHVVPQEFVLDRQGGILEPVGMLATRLEARVYAVTVSSPIKDNLVLAANQAGIEVQELIFAPLAVAEACLQAEERHAGVAIVDLGAGSTGIVVYSQGSLAHAAVIPVGGDHFTNDIAIGLSTPQPEAERIKCNFGAVTSHSVGENSAIEVPSLGDGPPRLLPHRRLCECIEPRARELIHLIHTEIARPRQHEGGLGLGAGIVLSGGAGRLQGFSDMLADAVGVPVRTAEPMLIEGMPPELGEPEFAFTVGACYYAHRLISRQPRQLSLWEKLRQRWEAFAE